MHKIGMLDTKDVLFEILYDDKAKTNPYKVYNKYWDHGWHKRLLNKYADLASCTAYINNYVMEHNEEER
jgi:hypothetical protein